MTELESLKDLSEAFSKLRDNLKGIPGAVSELMDGAQDLIAAAYAPENRPGNPAIVMRVTSRSGGGWESSVFAEGERLGFLEFGTGARVSASSGIGDEVLNASPFQVAPGSWSRLHDNTWDEFLARGGDPNKYPYNHKPTHGFQQGYSHVMDEIGPLVRRAMHV